MLLPSSFADSPRTFDLFKRTGVPLIDYKLSGENTPKRYNGITVIRPKEGALVEEDPFHVSESKGGVVPDEYAIPNSSRKMRNYRFQSKRSKCDTRLPKMTRQVHENYRQGHGRSICSSQGGP